VAQQFNQAPTYNQPLTVGQVTSKDWYFFWQGIWKGLAPEAEVALTPTASPYTYSAPRKGFVIVSGGTVSQIRFSRNGTTFYNVGATAGTFTLNAADRLEVTYTVVPTMTFVPT
jgi:hypothetical protein